MFGPTEKYTVTQPLRHEPAYVKQIRELAERTDGIASAMAEVFCRANILVRVIGDTTQWEKGGKGALLIGDHRDRIEFAPLLAVLGNMGREDMHFFSKPFSTNARVIKSLGRYAAGVTLPVVPGTLARDRANVWNRDLGWRIVNRNHLPTRDEIAVINANTLARPRHSSAQVVSLASIPPEALWMPRSDRGGKVSAR